MCVLCTCSWGSNEIARRQRFLRRTHVSLGRMFRARTMHVYQLPTDSVLGDNKNTIHIERCCAGRRSFECSIGRLRRALIYCCLIDSISIRLRPRHPHIHPCDCTLYSMRHHHFNIVSIDWTYILMKRIQSIFSERNSHVLSRASCNSDVANDVRRRSPCQSVSCEPKTEIVESRLSLAAHTPMLSSEFRS